MNYGIAFLVVGLTAITTALIVGLIYGMLALLGDPLGGIVALGIVLVAMFFLIAAADAAD